jgi:hypothetical protein
VWEHFFDGAINQIWIWEAELLAAERMKDVATKRVEEEEAVRNGSNCAGKTKW